MDLISSKAALCENIMEDPVHHSSPQNEPADHQSSSQNVNHSSPQNEPISNSRNMTRTARRHVSPKQTSGVFCRICHEGDFMESLLSPCSCSGSVSQQMIDRIKSHFPTRWELSTAAAWRSGCPLPSTTHVSSAGETGTVNVQSWTLLLQATVDSHEKI